ncbi:MAG TPA: zinc-binding dehydrogenase [Solimonas sp.]|nr:zinc-binding dehydrogenase [Solimonas sp.]
MSTSWLGPIRQISYATDDLDRLIGFWESRVGVGPWSVYRGLTLQMQYEGRPVTLPFDVALAMHGEQLIELIQVQGRGPSPFHDALDRPIIGLQRLAALSDDIQRDSEAAVARGMERFAEGVDLSGQRYVYFRSAEAPGVILELLENTPSFAGFLGLLQARSRGYARAARAVTPAAMPVAGTMQAALLQGYGGVEQFRIETVAEPLPGPGQVRIRVAAAAVNPVDLKARRGDLRAWMPLSFPARLGGDVSGIVDAVGSGVSSFAPGDRVMGMVNPIADGAYAGCMVADAASLARVPEALDLVDAAALPTGVLTGTQLVERGIRPAAGSLGLVTGAAGSSGRAALLAALDAGARVYAGIRGADHGQFAGLPLAGVIDLEDAAAVVAAGPFDFVADTVGGGVAERLFAALKPEGVLASTAFPPPNPPAASTQRFTSLVVRFDGPRLLRFAREMDRPGRRTPIAHRLPLAQVAEAHRLMEQGRVGGKILLLPRG